MSAGDAERHAACSRQSSPTPVMASGPCDARRPAPARRAGSTRSLRPTARDRAPGYAQQPAVKNEEHLIPTVSPSTIPLVYCHIKSFQQASSVERPWPGGENRTAGRASHHEELCGDWVVSPPVWTTGLSLIAVRGLIGATPWGQPWAPAVTLPHRRDGLRARQMAVLWTFREPSLCRHVPREFMRKAVLNLTIIIPATACH